MLSRTFKYTGYDGQPHEDTWWFNLSEAELWKLELANANGMNGMLRKLLRNEQTKEIVEVFENIILSSVGERSADGRKFIKNDQIREDFYQSRAYSDLFVELVSSGEKLAAFLKGVMPEELAAKLAKAEEEKQTALPAETETPATATGSADQ